MRRRLPRILLNAVTIVSAVLCVATVVLWARSYWYVTNLVRIIGASDSYYLGSMDGMFSFSEWNHARGPGGWELFDAPIARPSPPNRAMFVFFGIERGGGPGQRYVSICWVYLSALTAILPLVRAHRAWSRKPRLPRAHCPACGYDLRATPGRCPECGAAVPAGPPA